MDTVMNTVLNRTIRYVAFPLKFFTYTRLRRSDEPTDPGKRFMKHIPCVTVFVHIEVGPFFLLPDPTHDFPEMWAISVIKIFRSFLRKVFAMQCFSLNFNYLRTSTQTIENIQCKRTHDDE